MARQRTGTLEYRQGLGYFLRVTIDVVKDGEPTTERPWIDLGTHDKARALRMQKKIAAEVAAGRIVRDVREQAKAASTVKDEAEDYVTRRRTAGVVMVDDEERYLKLHVIPVIGDMEPSAVRVGDVRRVLDRAVANQLAKGSVSHIRRIMLRVFGDMYRAERLAENPVARVRMRDLQIREVKKKRVTLTDEEIAQFLAFDGGDIEVKILALVARAEGGMRTCELNRWTWADIDLEGFASCWIPRGKGAEPQQLEVPPVVGLFLRRWWEAHGCPTSGPVFPVRRGDRKGEHKAERTSYARRLRRDLLRAGVRRHEVHNDTARTLRADFHSFRRAFAGAAAKANLNAQQSMALTGHSDMRTHQRYIVEEFREIPSEIVPLINPANVPVLSLSSDDWQRRLARKAVKTGTPGQIRTADQRLRRLPDSDEVAPSPEENAPGATLAVASEGTGFLAQPADSSPADDCCSDDEGTIDGRAVHPLFAVFETLQ